MKLKFSMRKIENLGILFFLSLPLIGYLFIPEKIRYDAIFVIFVFSGIIGFVIAGISIILKITVAHFYKISWLIPVSLADIKERSGSWKMYFQIIFIIQNIVTALICIMFSSFVLIYYMGE